MNILLYLPGLLVVLVQLIGVTAAAGHLLLLGLIQGLVAWPFLSTYPQDYLNGAFDFSRVFLYKWTVNWRFLSEETFLSPKLSTVLGVGHILTLILFGFAWCRPDGGVVRVLDRALRRPTLPAGNTAMTPDRTLLPFSPSLICH